jgi:hypothetical protein
MSRRHKPPAQCEHCHKPFYPRRGQRFCSVACGHVPHTLDIPLVEIAADYHQGLTLIDISEKWGYPSETIYQHLRRLGLKGFGLRTRLGRG